MAVQPEAAMQGRKALTLAKQDLHAVCRSHGVAEITAMGQSASEQAPALFRCLIASWKRVHSPSWHSSRLRTGNAKVLIRFVSYLLARRSGKCQLRSTLSYNIGFRFGFKLDLVKRNSRLMVLLVTLHVFYCASVIAQVELASLVCCLWAVHP